jgi:hypothetical protein
MPMRNDAQALRHGDRGIAARVVDEQHQINDVMGDGVETVLECFLRQIRRHYDDDLFPVQHD